MVDRNFEVLEGAIKDRSDFSDTEEEVESYAVRLRKEMRKIYELAVAHDQARGNPEHRVVRDPLILEVFCGLDMLIKLAETAGERGFDEIADMGAKDFARQQGETNYRGYMLQEADSLRLMTEVMLGDRHDLETAYPSPVWQAGELADAIHDMGGHAFDVMSVIVPREKGEKPLDYNRRLRAFLNEKGEKIRAMAEGPLTPPVVEE